MAVTSAETPETVTRLLREAREGRQRSLGRLISWVENEAPELRPLAAEVAPYAGGARIIGLTGSPGVGKSTLAAGLVAELRRRDERVAVLAVDPSSPFTGGALLGDRVRMQQVASDDGVFIRSMATRGQLGGLAAAVPQATRVLDAVGFDTVIIETVGVGQSEVEIADLADVTVVVTAPGLGDGVQAAKAGILEIGDVFVVNKADREGAHALLRELRGMISLGQRPPGAWRPSVLTTVATEGEGLDALADQLVAFADHAVRTGTWSARRLARAQHEIATLALGLLRARMSFDGADRLTGLAQRVRDGGLDPFSAAEELLR
jgi:LAO/AO transport system kinase